MKAACNKIEKEPDIVLTYLDRAHQSKEPERVLPNEIEILKEVWPDVYIIAIIGNPRQREEIRTAGADKVLFDGITPAHLLASIETIELQSK